MALLRRTMPFEYRYPRLARREIRRRLTAVLIGMAFLTLLLLVRAGEQETWYGQSAHVLGAVALGALGVGLYRLNNWARILTAITLLVMLAIGALVLGELSFEQAPLLIIPAILLTPRMRAWFAFARGDLDRGELDEVLGDEVVPEFTDLPDLPG